MIHEIKGTNTNTTTAETQSSTQASAVAAPAEETQVDHHQTADGEEEEK